MRALRFTGSGILAFAGLLLGFLAFDWRMQHGNSHEHGWILGGLMIGAVVCFFLAQRLWVGRRLRPRHSPLEL